MEVTEILSSLEDANIEPGDALMVHGDMVVAAQLRVDKTLAKDLFFNTLLEYLGPDGTLIVPSFTYSFTNSEDFNVQKTESTLGSFSETFRLMEGVKRSRNPIFSVCVKGKHSNLFKDSDITDCFGEKSCFGILNSMDAKLMNLACNFEQTFTHYVEQMEKVPYRYFKTFTGTILDDGKEIRTKTKYFVGKKNIKYQINSDILKGELLQEDKLVVVPFGRFASYTVSCSDFVTSAKRLLKKDIFSLIQQGCDD